MVRGKRGRGSDCYPDTQTAMDGSYLRKRAHRATQSKEGKLRPPEIKTLVLSFFSERVNAAIEVHERRRLSSTPFDKVKMKEHRLLIF